MLLGVYIDPNSNKNLISGQTRVKLTKEEREYFEVAFAKGKRAARTLLNARAVFLVDAGKHG